MASTNPIAQSIRRTLIDLELSSRAIGFDKDERRLVLQTLLELVEKVAKLEDSAVQDMTES